MSLSRLDNRVAQKVNQGQSRDRVGLFTCEVELLRQRCFNTDVLSNLHIFCSYTDVSCAHMGENLKRKFADTMEAAESEVRVSPFMSMFEVFRAELDEHHDRRERIVKSSRDITAASKKM